MKILKFGKNNSNNVREKELIKNTIIITIGKIGVAIVGFLLLPILTTYMSTESYGVVDLINTYVSLATMFITLQIEQGCFRFLIESRNNNWETERIISTATIGIILQLILGCILLLGIAYLTKIEHGMLFSICCIVNATLTFEQQVSRGLGNNCDYAVSGIIVALLNMIFNIICVVFLKWDVNGVLIATILSSFISIVYLIIKNHVRLNHFYNDIYIKLISYSAPLILNSVSWWIFNVSDRTLITIFLGASSNGVYSIANKFSGICTTIYGMFNMAWTETISKSIDDSDRDEFLSENINKITNIFFSIIIILIAFMPIIFRILINEKYNMAYLQIPILLVAAYYYCKSAIIGAVYIALKDTKEIAATSMGAAVLNLLINVLFINEIGLYAASFSTLISYFILYMYRFIKLKKKIGVKYMPIDALAKIIVLVICLSLYYTNTGVSNIINIMFSVIVTSVFLNKLQ